MISIENGSLRAAFKARAEEGNEKKTRNFSEKAPYVPSREIKEHFLEKSLIVFSFSSSVQTAEASRRL